jgi:hypothetical protein
MKAVLRFTPVAFVGIAIAVLWIAVGAPDIGAVGPLFQGSRFDAAAGLALSRLILWGCALSVAGYLTVIYAFRALRTVARARVTVRASTLVALIGVAVLVAGIARHVQPVHVCCGSVQEARSALGR